MIKSLIFLFLSGMTLSAHAQNSSRNNYNVCMNTLEKYFLASQSEATTVCRQNSSPAFLQCMVHRAKNSNIHVLEAFPKCSSFRVTVPAEPQSDSRYVNARSCPAKLQIHAKMTERMANEVCAADSSEVMQTCIIDLVQKARFYPGHADQYCEFASKEYKRKIPNFVACVIDNSRGYFNHIGRHNYYSYEAVKANIVDCDYKMVGGVVIKPKPPTRPDVPPTYEPNYPPPVQPAPVPPTQPEVAPTPQPQEEEPAPKTGGRKVPTPVEIKIEGSSQPEVTGDQPIETGDTSNSGSLPL